jgi:hypothetical protein
MSAIMRSLEIMFKLTKSNKDGVWDIEQMF